MKAAMATTTPISQGFTLGRHGSGGRGDAEFPTEEFSDRRLLMPSALSAIFSVYSCGCSWFGPGHFVLRKKRRQPLFQSLSLVVGPRYLFIIPPPDGTGRPPLRRVEQTMG